jgi:hypothetical protein
MNNNESLKSVDKMHRISINKYQSVKSVWGNNHLLLWDYTKHVHSLYGQNAKFLNVKGCGTYTYHCVLKICESL